jgi:hypothetical protein
MIKQKNVKENKKRPLLGVKEKKISILSKKRQILSTTLLDKNV